LRLVPSEAIGRTIDTSGAAIDISLFHRALAGIRGMAISQPADGVAEATPPLADGNHEDDLSATAAERAGGLRAQTSSSVFGDARVRDQDPIHRLGISATRGGRVRQINGWRGIVGLDGVGGTSRRTSGF
jgi:hypothetical protein